MTTQPGDFGPIYAETDMSRIPVEPWATYSNLAFLAICVYWAARLRKDWRSHPLLAFSIPMMFAGFAGGAVYHATRGHSFWLLLDYLPIMMLVLTAAIFFWREITDSWAKTFLATLGPPFLYRLATLCFDMPEKVSISIGYSVLGLTAALPAVLHCRMKNPEGARWLSLSAASFLAALAFRQGDWLLAERGILPQGSHFLWHLFGAASAFFIMRYLYAAEGRGKG